MVEVIISFLIQAVILFVGCILSYNTGYKDGWNNSLNTLEEEVRDVIKELDS